MGQCFSSTDHMQKIGKCKNEPTSQYMGDKLGGTNLKTTTFIWSQLLYHELAS